MKHSPPSATRMGPVRVIIADDHELARAGLRSMLESERGLEVVGEAADGQQALALCRHLTPDLALLDVRMPTMDGLAAARAIKQACPATAILIVTTHEDPDYLLQALKVGAAGYLLKDVTRHELLVTIRRVLRGESVLSGEMAARALQRLSDERAHRDEPAPERLTPREREVLALIVEGQTNREIAAKLSLSVGTVKIHVEHIIAKLGVADRTQAAVRALEHGLLSASPR